MIIAIILCILITMSVVLRKKYSNNYKSEGLYIFYLILNVLFSLYLAFHLLFCGLAGYNYNVFKVKRDAFVSTLNNSRENGNELEVAAIVNNISKWNEELSGAQYQNTLFLLDDYIDDRADSLKPIK